MYSLEPYTPIEEIQANHYTESVLFLFNFFIALKTIAAMPDHQRASRVKAPTITTQAFIGHAPINKELRFHLRTCRRQPS